MAKKSRTWITPVVILAVAAGGYVVADIQDVAPGILTTAPPWPQPDPFPTPIEPQLQTISLPGLPGADAPVPLADQVQSLTDDLIKQLGGEVTVQIRDVTTNEVLADHQPTTALVPASTTKLATAVAALAAAGSDYRFTTEVAYDGDSNLYLIGGGDLMLAPGYGDPAAVKGHAGLADLADAIADRLASDEPDTADKPDTADDSNKGVRLYVDESLYAGPLIAPEWGPGDLAGGWAMNIRPLAVDLGVVEDEQAREVEPGLAAGRQLRDLLQERGIDVEAEVGKTTAPEGASTVASVKSARLDDVVAAMLIPSENIAAEGIGRLVAQKRGEEVSFAGTGKAIVAQLAELGVDTSAMQLHDASGLSSLNKISADTLVDIVQVAYENSEYIAAITGMPIGGLEGTLAQRMVETAAAGSVFAKTGTLNVSVALAGLVLTADDRALSFAVVANEAQEGNWSARVYIDRFMAELAACGC